VNQQIVKHGLYLLDRKHRAQRYKHPISSRNAFGFAFVHLKATCPEEAAEAVRIWEQQERKLDKETNHWMWEDAEGKTYLTEKERNI
jgi:pyruvate/2-oxoacid:ferredoxin oxidoreductase beta subunit